MPQYHKADLPSGLFVMGDAFMALNPVYGQGMTVASMGAVLLDKHLTKALGKRSAKKDAAAARTAIHAAAPRFHKKQHKQNGIAWSMATAEDMRYDGVETVGVPHPPEAIYRYTDGLFKACQKDWKVWKRVLRVAQLLDPPSKMFSPRMLRYGLPAVLWGKKGRKVKPMAQPEKEAAEVESVSSVEEVPAVVSVASDEVSGVEKGVEEVPVMMVQAQAGRPVAVM